MGRNARGFTLIELVAVLAVLGIVAVTIALRWDTTTFKTAAFHDQTVAALRYAQKTATSHRRTVCVAFTASTVTLTIASTHGSTTCDTPLPVPGGNGNTVVSGDSAKAVFNPVPSALSFQADGTTTGQSLSISGQSAIVVNGTSGYVQ